MLRASGFNLVDDEHLVVILLSGIVVGGCNDNLRGGNGDAGSVYGWVGSEAAESSLSSTLKFGNTLLFFFVFIDGRGDDLRNIGLVDVLMSVKSTQGGLGATLELSDAPFFFLVLIKESSDSPRLIDGLDGEVLHGDGSDERLVNGGLLRTRSYRRGDVDDWVHVGLKVLLHRLTRRTG